MKRHSKNKKLARKFEDFDYPVEGKNWDAISEHLPPVIGHGALSDHFADYTYRPSHTAWQAIAIRLQSKARRRRTGWWWYAAAVAVFILAMYTGFFAHLDGSQKGTLTQNSVTHSKNSPSSSAFVDSSTTVAIPSLSSDSDLSGNEAPKATSIDHHELYSPASEAEVRNPQKFNKAGYSRSNARNENHSVNISNPNRTTAAGSRKFYLPENGHGRHAWIASEAYLATLDAYVDLEAIPVAILYPKSEESSKEDTSPESVFFDGNEKNHDQNVTLLAGSQLAFQPNNYNDQAVLFSFPEVNLGNSLGSAENIEEIYGQSYYQVPTYYGLHVELPFLRLMVAGSGLGYLNMQREKQALNSLGYLTIVERTGYLSIPLYLKFNFIHTPKFSTFLSSGHSFDFQVWQNTTTSTENSGQATPSTSIENVSRKNQASLYVGLGLSWKFTDHLGVFVEGNALRYYKVSSENFYGQQNLWPTLRFGAIVSF